MKKIFFYFFIDIESFTHWNLCDFNSIALTNFIFNPLNVSNIYLLSFSNKNKK